MAKSLDRSQLKDRNFRGSLADFSPKKIESDSGSNLPEDKPAKFVYREKKDYPVWVCPVPKCLFTTQYKPTINSHLRRVHGWKYHEVGKELDKFTEAKKSSDRWVNPETVKSVKLVISDVNYFGGGGSF